MIFILVVLSVFCALFFYCEALKSGLGVKRWTFAGLLFGPLVWPMFTMNKRMKVNRLFGFNYLLFKA